MQDRFERVEKKYLLSKVQYEGILAEMPSSMTKDVHDENVTRSLYYDTDDFRLIRTSIEKPFYKEKLRVRSYGRPGPDDKVYVEIKKKMDGIVYKRRSSIPYKKFLEEGCTGTKDGQIGREVGYFLSYYEQLKPACLISCERSSWRDGDDFRITFDSNLMYSFEHPSLDYDGELKRILDDDRVIMEIKIVGAIPLWLSHVLDKYKVFIHPFSKYGYAYKKEFLGVTV